MNRHRRSTLLPFLQQQLGRAHVPLGAAVPFATDRGERTLRGEHFDGSADAGVHGHDPGDRPIPVGDLDLTTPLNLSQMARKLIL